MASNRTGIKRIAWLSALVAAAFYLIGSWYQQEQRLVPASFRLINDAQTAWYADPVEDYRIVVDVIRPGERRRCEVVVRDGQIYSATVKYVKPNWPGWNEPYALNDDQAYPFTVPGLYDMIRLPLRNNARQSIRVDMRGEPPFPHTIVFDPLWEAGERLPETKARVVVRSFETTTDR